MPAVLAEDDDGAVLAASVSDAQKVQFPRLRGRALFAGEGKQLVGEEDGRIHSS
jgi:hypothetical protein